MSAPIIVPDDTRKAQGLASEPKLSAWVSANAGSGKTHVLASRVMRLLLEGADPSRILCLTYTRAAAANMATRVFKNLSGWATLPDAELAKAIEELDGKTPTPSRLKRARRLFARALETPGGLKIQTIHAFCEAVLHQFPLEANIAGHFELLDSQMEEALVAEARREMIARATEGNEPGLADTFATVLQRGGEAGLETLLANIVGKRDALRRFIEQIGTGDGHFHALFEEFGFGPSDTRAALAASLWPDHYFTPVLCGNIGSKASIAGKTNALSFAENFGKACGATDPLDRLEYLKKAFFSGSGSSFKPRSAKTIMAKGVGEHFPEFPDEFERYCQEITRVLDRVELLGMLEDTRAALVLADWLIHRYERLKSARGFLDFNDLIVRTATLLSRTDAGAWVQYKLDKGIDHILLDEAQDTSPDQWAVVRALAAEFFAGEGSREGAVRTVFAVGDEKQSIYSFQGAEPEAFDRSGREFRERVANALQRFEHVRLTRSFRSTEDVLAAVDLVFSEPEHRDGLTQDPEPIQHLAIRANQPGHVELWPSLGPVDVEEPEDWTQAVDHASAPAVRLAEQIARTIDHWLRTGNRIEGRGRKVRPGDIMVLVRKRDRFIHALSRELKNRQIPVAGADRILLTGHIAVQDLLAAARVALQPDDDLSLAALLKSPAFGLDENELFELAAKRHGVESLLIALRRADKHKDVWETLVRWRNEAGYRKPFEFFSNLLARDGLRRKLIARLGAEAGDVVDEFLNFCLAAERTGVTQLEALVALLDRGGPEVKREMDQTRGEVRIMTAHASKGLEAPIVFLVDSGGEPFVDSHMPRLMPFSAPTRGWHGDGFLWRAGSGRANSFSAKLADEAKRKAEQEYRRLLYVGMTRAEDRLIVCGYHGKRGQKDGSWHQMVQKTLCKSPHTKEIHHPATNEKVLRYQVTPPLQQHEPEKPEGAAVTEPPPLPAELLSTPPAPPPLPRPLSPSGAGAMIEPEPVEMVKLRSPVLDAVNEPSFAIERGTAAHRLLQILPSIERERRASAAERYLARIGQSWPEGEREKLWASVEAILETPEFASLFSPGSRAEVSVMGRVKLGETERAISGKIDRLIVDGESVLIVDYKTNRPPPSVAAELPQGHVAQMALYRELLKPIYPGKQIRAALIYTETPILIPVPDEMMDGALARLTSA